MRRLPNERSRHSAEEESLPKVLGAPFTKLVVPAIVLAAGLLFGLFQATQATAARALTVCAAGPPSCQFSTIPDALAVAVDGDTVRVAPGSYTAGFTIGRSIRLIGSGTDATVITGGDPVGVTIASGATVLIRGVTVTDAARTGS